MKKTLICLLVLAGCKPPAPPTPSAPKKPAAVVKKEAVVLEGTASAAEAVEQAIAEV